MAKDEEERSATSKKAMVKDLHFGGGNCFVDCFADEMNILNYESDCTRRRASTT